MSSVHENINGPVNVIRVEGKIGKVNKVLYLFMDYHNNKNKQTKCDGRNNIDVNEYFINEFSKFQYNDKKLDVFLEIAPSDITNRTKSADNMIYIESVNNIMKNQYVANKYNSNKFKNIRFHYVDNRDNLELFSDYDRETYYKTISNINKLNMVYDSHIDLLYKLFTNSKQNYLNMMDSIRNPKKINKINLMNNNKTTEETIDSINYLLYKLVHSYSNTQVKSIIKTIVDNEVIPAFKYYQIGIDHILAHIQKYKNSDRDRNISFMSSLNTYVGRLVHISIILSSKILDVFLLRRFLDKDYITNGISYTGGLHSINLVMILVKHFNFKITNISNMNETHTIKSLNKFFLTMKNPRDDYDYFSNNNEQCSNIKDFPSNFE